MPASRYCSPLRIGKPQQELQIRNESNSWADQTSRVCRFQHGRFNVRNSPIATSRGGTIHSEGDSAAEVVLTLRFSMEPDRSMTMGIVAPADVIPRIVVMSSTEETELLPIDTMRSL